MFALWDGLAGWCCKNSLIFGGQGVFVRTYIYLAQLLMKLLMFSSGNLNFKGNNLLIFKDLKNEKAGSLPPFRDYLLLQLFN